MGHRSKIFCFIVAILVIVSCIPSFGQTVTSPNEDVQLGTVWFAGKSTKLTKEAKATLDTFIKQIQNSPDMQVKAVSFNKDLCDKCSNRSWKRTEKILKYLSKHGVSKNRLVSTNRLEGEFNKVDIFLTASISDSPHPGIKK
jgi:hypothetical protein